ncbi:hypothetical protein [Longimicrobium sp.]|uniref:hypothetical protein n=1 Tax=Longimicrobium sp. TaxID=2029185 RepID=UPI002B9893A6|nr:hypothetical protein [Longimicrobium sp.]HSU16296.1 hypothetical protein [Longimicrobium sp.]
MKKLRLELERLDVQSFDLVDGRQQTQGTVLGADAAMTLPEYCITFTCGDSRIRPCLED